MRGISRWYRRAVDTLANLAGRGQVPYDILWARTRCLAYYCRLKAVLTTDVEARQSLRYRQRWYEGVGSEVDWWRDWLTSDEGHQWSSAVQDPALPLQDATLAELVRGFPEQVIDILDVGPGPVTHLGYTFPGKELKITAIDPLARIYENLLRDLNINAPVKTVFGYGELLRKKFAQRRFDIAYASNALDHSYDPLCVINNMLAAVKRGRYVVLRHYQNEGETGDYHGLHQWNFDVEGDDFVIWNATRRHNVTRLLADEAQVTCGIEDARSHGLFDHSDWVMAVITKH